MIKPWHAHDTCTMFFILTKPNKLIQHPNFHNSTRHGAPLSINKGLERLVDFQNAFYGVGGLFELFHRCFFVSFPLWFYENHVVSMGFYCLVNFFWGGSNHSKIDFF